MGSDIWQTSAVELAASVARGEVTAAEVVESHLDRIAAVNPRLNAVTGLLADRARAAAGETDRRRAAGEPLGPLAGVPFTVKDNIHVAGMPTTQGVPEFQGLVAEADSPPVERLCAAGAIPLARTNMPDMGMRGVHTRSGLHGDTVNPWDPARSPGGTSGGDAVAVASGMAPLGLANDWEGSNRIPAAFCGVVGVRPSYGRYASDNRLAGREPQLSSLLFPVDGPLTRTVADARAVHQVLAGADPRDPRTVPVPPTLPLLDGPVRVGVVADPGGLGVHPDVRAAVELAAGALADAGYVVEEVELPRLEEALDAYGRLVMTDYSLTWPMVRTLMPEDGCRFLEMSMERTPPVGLEGYVKLIGTRLGVQRAWTAFQETYPLVLGPVFTEPAIEPGLEARGPEELDRVWRAQRLCSVATFLGLPAVAVPTGVVAGLPQGVQLIGRAYREDLCLDAAAAVEARRGTFTPLDPRD
ncbi:putative amidase [Streptomyces sp. NBRC 110611]|uniref:amidase n=1 Tax=Streptomyces sp. NBRC 110611 TaxID=1621259 RepID=UPI00082BAA67|nr:amidase [Streptomyces sp. NBRC 110611]GAU67582.1 putative amidase [Streptomyces sp. NBRC 110611]